MQAEVILDGRGCTAVELIRSAGTLLPAAGAVEVVNVDDPTLHLLQGRFGPRVRRGDVLHPDVPLVVTSGKVIFARGALRRLLAAAGSTERCVTRVLVPGLEDAEQVTCWSVPWLSTYGGGLSELVDAGLDFDRQHLPAGSGLARAWVPADEVGVVLASDIPADTSRWSRRAGVRFWAAGVWGNVRAPVGAARRRWMRRRQRGQAAGGQSAR